AVAWLDRDPDLDTALAGELRIAADAEMAEGGPEEPGEDERLGPGRPFARVDIDERERRPVRRGQPAGPGMDLECGLVAEPAQGGRPVGHEMEVVPLCLDARRAPSGEPCGVGRSEVLLPEPR